MWNFILFLPILATSHPTQPKLVFLEDLNQKLLSNSNNFVFPKQQIQNGDQLITNMRLPKSIKAVHYDLHLKVYLPDYGALFEEDKKFTFEGTVAIHFNAIEEVEEIYLNQLDLEIETVELQYKGITVLLNFHMNNQLERIKIQTFLIQGPGTLLIRYKGVMGPYNNTLIGLYKSEYAKDGKKFHAAVTQFEAHDARRMVPCFDEPEYKATWDVTLLHPNGTNALSNQEIINKRSIGSWFETSFATTPMMSSYLLAIYIANVEVIEGKTKHGLKVKMHFPEDEKTGKSVALQAAIECFDYFEDLFGIPIPLNKTDFVVANDFFFGAMENWGLIVFNRDAIKNAGIICHEIAHYWFGNLVTLQFWEYIWLNEGWTTFMASEGVKNILNGTYAIKLVDSQQEAFDADIDRGRYPLVRRLIYHRDIMDINSNILYKKGALIVNMIKQIIGEQNFNQGIRNYLNKFAYKNVVQSDLFGELDAIIPEDLLGPDGNKLNVTKFSARWTYQIGFPLVKLNKNGTHCLFSQERYTLNQIGDDDPRYKKNIYQYKWDVPIWLSRNSKDEFYWLPFDKNLLIPCSLQDDILVNKEKNGYYDIEQY